MDDAEEKYVITPKGLATLSILDAGLSNDINDRRIDVFWELFSMRLEKAGYIADDEE